MQKEGVRLRQKGWGVARAEWDRLLGTVFQALRTWRQGWASFLEPRETTCRRPCSNRFAFGKLPLAAVGGMGRRAQDQVLGYRFAASGSHPLLGLGQGWLDLGSRIGG